MAIALHSYKIDDDGEIRVCHTFYGDTLAEAEKVLADHAEICPKYGPAYKADDTIEVVDEIEDLPTTDSVLEDVEDEDVIEAEEERD